MEALLDDVRLFVARADCLGLAKFISKYQAYLPAVLYQDAKFVRELVDGLRTAIGVYARLNSPAYSRRRAVVSKSNLRSLRGWQVEGVDSIAAETGGSTTGRRFRYCRWPLAYDALERVNHYEAIIDEFRIPHRAQILYLMHDQTHTDSDLLIKTYTTDDIVISHGLRRSATVHEAMVNKTYWLDHHRYFQLVLEYATDKNIDVIMAPGHVIASLAWNAKRIGWSRPICRLLSNTGEQLDLKDAHALQDLGCIGSWCDHMRCWDGGVTFFTCRHGTYHLLDHVAYARSDLGHRLISDDFFSLATPFVNYWNGDYADIGHDYRRCRCGRLYRPFRMGRTRSFAVNHINNESMRNRLDEVGLGKVLRISMFGARMLVFLREQLTGQERTDFRDAFPTFTTMFVIED